jgi:hypothetical protein
VGNSPAELIWMPAGRCISTVTQSCSANDAALYLGAGFGTAAVWPTTNLAIFVPFQLSDWATAKQMQWVNNTPVNNHLDAGVYDVQGNLIVSTGSISVSGTVQVQDADLTDTVLSPGHYYMALSRDTASTYQIFRATPNALLLQACGVQQMASAFPLPSVATFANPANAFLPWFGVMLAATA